MKKYIVRYSEIGLKSKFVRKELIKKLIENINKKLIGFKEIKTEGPRIIIKTDDKNAEEKLILTPGIKNISEIKYTTKKTLKDIQNACLSLFNKYKPNTFKIETQRIDKKFKYTSMEINKLIGDKINSKVNLSNPELTIYIEINEKKAYIFNKKINCIGGLPYDSQGKAVLLLSEGIDSPVAGYFLMKRGVKLILLHLGEKKESIIKITNKLNEIGDTKLIFYPYEKILKKIAKIAGKDTCIICKKTMLKIAEKIAKKENAQAIITGFSIGQVASQTLSNLFYEMKDISIPILTPLIGFDKQEIINIAKEIGTYDLSVKNKVCKYVPKHPSTKINLMRLSKIEKEINLDQL